VSARHLLSAALVAALVSFLPRASAAAPASSAAADTLYAHQDWARALRAYEALAKKDPTIARYPYRIGVSAAALERWPRAIAAYRRAEALGIPPMFARYNLACAFARAGQADSALATLESLVATGYRTPETIEQDADFASIRADERYAAAVAVARRNASPCVYAPESRQFDFWVGDWEVHDNARNQIVVGASHVERILNQCVIFENWTGGFGGSGKSFNAWNAELGCWQQNWMDDTGGVTNFTDGHYEDGRLVFMADKKGPAGQAVKNRLTFFNLGPDQVRQFSEQSTDGGATWSVVYDFNYERKKT
jgi:hypothetical protein